MANAENNLTDKDKKLIERAKRVGIFDWDQVQIMETQADTEEARRRLHDIAMELHHAEEYMAGCL